MRHTKNHGIAIERMEQRVLLSAATALPIFQSRFTGNTLNTALWKLPVYNADGSTYYGRTQERVQGTSDPPIQSGGKVELADDSYNPTDTNGNLSFYGAEVQSMHSYSIGTGLDIKFQARMNTPIPGEVGGLFVYGLNGTDASGNPIRNEIDVAELVTTYSGMVNTNVFADQGFSTAGSPEFDSLPNKGQFTQYHTYEAKIYPTEIMWYVDGKLVRQLPDTINPDAQMQVMFNIWTPDNTWADAYNPGIQAVASPRDNLEGTMDVRYVGLFSIQSKAPKTQASPPATTTPPPVTTPSITITNAANAWTSEVVKGNVTGTPSDYAGVAVYIEVDGGWWTKPYFDAPLSAINSSGTWSTDFVTGGDDADATQLVAYLIPQSMADSVPLSSGDPSLPTSLSSLPSATISRA